MAIRAYSNFSEMVNHHFKQSLNFFENIFCEDESPPFVPKYNSWRENCGNHISYEGNGPCKQRKLKAYYKSVYFRENNNLVFKCIAANMHTFSFLLLFRQCKVRTLLLRRRSDALRVSTLLSTIFYTKILFRSEFQNYYFRKQGYVLKLPPKIW